MTPRRRIHLIGLASVLVGLIWLLALFAPFIAGISPAPGGGEGALAGVALPSALVVAGILAMIASVFMRKE